ncbi:hypothetical protein HD806DRAFT_532221 [Xylariaceae sp. AK1471]|nr:hypothetical protein HD806DRAFT_532221 [Xylariaceae sp. AK1471]
MSELVLTRFATEISLRRGPSDKLTIRIIPDEARPPTEKRSIKAFAEFITDFDDLPQVMDLAMVAMGIANKDGIFEDSMAELLVALDYTPLAITQAAAYIDRRPRMTVSDYLDEFRGSE